MAMSTHPAFRCRACGVKQLDDLSGAVCANCRSRFTLWCLPRGLNPQVAHRFDNPPYERLRVTVDFSRPEVQVAFDEWLSTRESPAPE